MSYIPLRTDGTPQSIRDFVRLHVDMQLHDVHTMLRLPIREEPGMEGGCNFATVSVLCSVIAGASTVFFRQGGLAGLRFEELLTRFYPWHAQRPGGVEPQVAVRAIYRDTGIHWLMLSLSQHELWAEALISESSWTRAECRWASSNKP